MKNACTFRIFSRLTLTLCLFSVTSCFKTAPNTTEDLLEVRSLDVGQGDATLISLGDQHLLVDLGPSASILNQRLRAAGVDSIATVILTHQDLDHVGGWEALKDLKIGRVSVGSDDGGTQWDNRVAELKTRGIPVDTLYRQDTLHLGQAHWQVLWPPRHESLTGNAASLVLRGGLQPNNTLLTGDLEQEQEKALLDSGDLLQAQVLKVAHHGSAGASSSDFLARVQPQIALISCGLDNRYGHPTPEALGRLYTILGDSSLVLRTDLRGDQIARLAPAGIVQFGKP